MNVAELIAALSAFPPEMKVHVLVADGYLDNYADEANAAEVTDGWGLSEPGVLIHIVFDPRTVLNPAVE